MKITATFQTNPGNSPIPIQDNVYCQTLSESDQTAGLYIVADGMGGHSDGDLASQMTIDLVVAEIRQHFAQQLSSKTEALAAALRRAIKRANQAVFEKAQAKENGMGSTITAVLIYGNQAIVANVGDSRTYLFRQGQLQQITEDHSVVEELIKRGIMPEEERLGSHYINVVTRAIGSIEDITVDVFPLALLPGDRLLLCSDGLWEMVQDEQIAYILQNQENLDQICETLITAANTAGGKDHISVVLVELESVTEDFMLVEAG